MNWIYEIVNDKNFKADLYSFCNKYGISGLKQAMKMYIDMQYKYICKTKSSISKISIEDIYYLEIREHNISVHTQHGIYHKYGTLNKELKVLAPYGFIKCNQSFIVSLSKIKSIVHDELILVNGTKIHMSRNYATKVIFEFSKK